MTTTMSINRRKLIQGMSAAGAIGLSWPAFGQAHAQGARTIETFGVNSLFTPKLKAIIESEANVSLTNGPFQSSVDTVSRLSAPGGTQYDLLISSYDFSWPVVMGAKEGQERTQPVTVEDIPNLKHINKASQYALNPRNGRHYIVPLLWGFDTVLYNTKLVDPNDDLTRTWGLLFDDKYAGRIAWWDTPLNMLMAAGLYLGHETPDTMDRKELDEVGRFLIGRKKNVRTIFTSFAQGSSLLANEEVVACYSIASMRVDLQNRGYPVAGAYCKEGVLSVIQSGYIPKNSRRHKIACDVMNAMLGAAYAKELTPDSGYLSTSTLADQQFSAEDIRRFGFGIFDGSIKYYPQKFPQKMNDWIEVWSRVKSA